MAEFNTIKVKQLDSSVWAYISGLFSGGFASILNSYLADGGSLGINVVYTTDSDQTIDGKKSFVQSPTVPYSGQTGDAPSRQYVDDQISVLSATVTPLQGAQFLYATGNQNVSGTKTFLGAARFANPIVSSLNGSAADLSNSTLLDQGGETTLNWHSRSLNGAWTVDGKSLVFATDNQSIQGIKTFTTEVNVPTAVNAGNPVPYSQFRSDLLASESYFDTLFESLALTTSSGFGGILGINGQSGYIFTQGRGNVTVWQQGNILNISGADIVRQEGDSVFRTNTVNIPSGASTYRVDFAQPYSLQPIVVSQLENSSSDPILASLVSGVDVSGFTVVFSDATDSSNYKVSYVAFDASGVISLLKGEQGLMGPYLQGKGLWETGKSYGYLDFVRTPNGVSWYAKSGHVSDLLNGPLATGGTGFWDVLASGAGPRGENAAPFIFAGTWDELSTYQSGYAVLYKGASYATLHNTTFGQAPTGSPWFVVAARGETGMGWNYKGAWDHTVTYSGGDTVTFNGATYLYPEYDGITGINAGPLSLNSKFKTVSPKPITYEGAYSATTIYYPYDIAHTSTGFNSGESVQYINNAGIPVYGLHPYGRYNIFSDCDGFSGSNLIQLTTGVKSEYHPELEVGHPSAFKLNNIGQNDLGSGLGAFILIRGNSYYFDSELPDCPFIFTESAVGGNYDGQIVDGLISGRRLSVSSGWYQAVGYDEHVGSGTVMFTPSASTPNEIYLQSPVHENMGWKFLVVDSNPWEVFSSGQRGAQGPIGESGTKGDPGLAFVWRGTWSALNGYNSGDAVYYDGQSYATQSPIIGTQPTQAPWFVVAKKGDKGEDARGLAFVWQGNWNTTQGYEPYDAVYYQGTSYATTGFVSGNYPPNLFTTYWFPIARQGAVGQTGVQGSPGLAFAWKGAYNHVTVYHSGDSVFFEGSSYGTRSTVGGVYPTGTGSNPWEIIAQKGGTIFSWRGTWAPTTTYYSGDAVFHAGSSFATLLQNTNHNPLNTSANPWFLVAQGSSGKQGPVGPQGPRGTGGLAFEWRGEWSATVEYSPYDSVYWKGSSYGTMDTINTLPSTQPDLSSKWFVIAQKGDPGLAFAWKGTWDTNTLYKPYESVYHDGRSYATTSYITTGIVPSPSTGPWFIVADKGGDAINETFYYNGDANTFRGFNIMEKFTPRDFVFTGYAISVNRTGEGTPLTGVIYRRNVASNKFTLATFTLSGGQYFVSSGGFNQTVFGMDRIGIDLGGGPLTNASGLAIGVFGWSA